MIEFSDRILQQHLHLNVSGLGDLDRSDLITELAQQSQELEELFGVLGRRWAPVSQMPRRSA